MLCQIYVYFYKSQAYLNRNSIDIVGTSYSSNQISIHLFQEHIEWIYYSCMYYIDQSYQTVFCGALTAGADCSLLSSMASR